MSSSGESESGSGKSGSSLGKRDTTDEEWYFRKKQIEQLEVLKNHLQDEVKHHEDLIKQHEEAIKRAKQKINELLK